MPAKLGRKRKRRAFEETKIGFFLKHEAPVEYELLTNTICNSGEPHADLVEQIGYSSDNPLFRKPKFRKALMEYRQHGLYSGKPITTDAATEMYYIKIRRAAEAKVKSGAK